MCEVSLGIFLEMGLLSVKGFEWSALRWKAVLISKGCGNKWPQIYWLKTTVLEARCLKSRCQQGWFLLEALRKGSSMPLFQLLVVASSPWHSLAHRLITPVPGSAFTWCSALWVSGVFYRTEPGGAGKGMVQKQVSGDGVGYFAKGTTVYKIFILSQMTLKSMPRDRHYLNV